MQKKVMKAMKDYKNFVAKMDKVFKTLICEIEDVKFVKAKSVSKKNKKKIVTKTVEPKSTSNRKQRICAISKNNRKRYFNSIKECSTALKVDVSNMWNALHGNRKSAGGYTFKYVD